MIENLEQPIKLNDLFPPTPSCVKIVNLNPLRFDRPYYNKGECFRNLRTKSKFRITSCRKGDYEYELVNGKNDLQIGDWTWYIGNFIPEGTMIKEDKILMDLLKEKDYYYSGDIIYDLSLHLEDFVSKDNFEWFVNWILKICNETDISKSR